MSTPNEKIVRYDRYCKLCEYWEKNQADEPCNTCLNNPTNGFSRKPVKYKKKGK